jgi:hypothetical protein
MRGGSLGRLRWWLGLDAYEVRVGFGNHGLRIVWRSYMTDRLMRPCGGFYHYD